MSNNNEYDGDYEAHGDHEIIRGNPTLWADLTNSNLSTTYNNLFMGDTINV